MDFSKSKVILKKINALHESAEAFNNELSKMERDLMLHYLREMYEMIMDAKGQPQEEKTKIEKTRTEVPAAFEKPAAIKTENGPLEEDFKKEPKKASPVMVDINGNLKNASVETEPSLPQQKSEAAPQQVELEALFEESIKGVMNSRFGQLPISDIAKSMGINDRIQTINELFDGDQRAFNNCTHDLNNLSNFDEARNYLMQGPAVINDWSSPVKRSKAKIFIQLIRRRYL